ncbi:mechanosensitive ion channel family protein [Vibrio breoganii]
MDELSTEAVSVASVQLTDNALLNEIIFLTTVSLALWAIWRILASALTKAAKGSSAVWVEVVLKGMKMPVTTIIWVWPTTVSIGLVAAEHFEHATVWLSTIRSFLLMFIVAWALYRMVTIFEGRLLDEPKYDPTTVQGAANVIRLIILVVAALSAMQALGVSLQGLLTFGGIGGLVVGLSAKEMLSNFFGGLFLYLDRPFSIGDWVRSPDREIEGTVEKIGWRVSVVRTFDKRPLYIPNSVFTSIVIENPSRMQNRRIYETIGLRYDDADKIKEIVDKIREMLRNHPDIDTRQTLIVNFNAFGDSSLDLFLYTFTKTVNWTRYHEVKEAVLLEVMAIIHENGGDVAYPTQTLKVENDYPMPGVL